MPTAITQEELERLTGGQTVSREELLRLDPSAAQRLPPEAPDIGQHGMVVGSLLRGIDNFESTIYAAGGILADIQGETDVRDWFLSGYLRNVREAQANPAEIASWRQIEGLGTAATYAIEGIMENVPMLIGSLVTGGTGALLAGAGRRAVGYGIGAYAGNWAQEAGSIYGDTFQKTGQLRPGIAAAYGAVAAGVDTAAEMLPFARIAKAFPGQIKAAAAVQGMGLAKEIEARLIARMGKAGAEQFIAEASTEALQSAIENAAVNHADPTRPFWTSQTVDDIVDGFLKGGIAGGALGVVSGIPGPRPEAPEGQPGAIEAIPGEVTVAPGAEERPEVPLTPEEEEEAGYTPPLPLPEEEPGAPVGEGVVRTLGAKEVTTTIAGEAAGTTTEAGTRAVADAAFGGATTAPPTVTAATTAAVTAPETAGTVAAAELTAAGAPVSAAVVAAETTAAAPAAAAPTIDTPGVGRELADRHLRHDATVGTPAYSPAEARAITATFNALSPVQRTTYLARRAEQRREAETAAPTAVPTPTTEVPGALPIPSPVTLSGGPPAEGVQAVETQVRGAPQAPGQVAPQELPGQTVAEIQEVPGATQETGQAVVEGVPGRGPQARVAPVWPNEQVEGKTATQILDEMLGGGLFDGLPAIKALARFIADRFQVNLPIRLISPEQAPENAAAFYSPGIEDFPLGIYLVNGRWNTRSPGNTAHNVLHEYVHALTDQFIKANPTHQLVKDLLHLGQTAYERAIAEGYSEFNIREKNLPYGLRRMATAGYGVADWNQRAVMEFVAEALSSKRLQEFLGQMQAPKEMRTSIIRTMWDALVDTVRKILGLKRGTALEASLRKSLELIAEAQGKTEAQTTTATEQLVNQGLSSLMSVEEEVEPEAPAAPAEEPTRRATGAIATEAAFPGFQAPVLEDERGVSTAQLGSSNYVKQREARREAYAKDFIDRQNNGDLFRARRNVGAIADLAYRSVVLSEITRRASEQYADAVVGDEALRSLILSAGSEIQALKTEVGTGLQSQDQTNRILGPVRAVLSHIGLIRVRQADLLKGKGVPDDLADSTREAWQRAGTEAADTMDTDEERSVLQQLLNFLKRQEEGATRKAKPAPTEAQSKAVLDRINAMFPLANWRELFTKKGTGQIADRFWKIMAAAREKPGHVATFEGIVSGELGRLLQQAMTAAGFTPAAPGEKLTTAARIAQFLGDDPLRTGKLKLIDEAVRADIASRDDPGLQEQLTELWDQAVGLMTEAPSSAVTARRLLQELFRDSPVDWKGIFSSNDPDAALAKARGGITTLAANRVQAAATNQLDLGPLRTLLGQTFDAIADIHRKRFEANQLAQRAREAYHLTIAPEKAAESIVSQFAKSQSDTPDFAKAPQNPMRDALRAYITGVKPPGKKEPVRISETEFRKRLIDLGVTGATADKVIAVANRELESRRISEWYALRQKTAEMLKSDKAIDRLLAKAGVTEGVDWSDIMQLSAATQQEQQRKLLGKITNDPRFSKLLPNEIAQLTGALFRAWDRRRWNIFRTEFGRLVDLPTVTQDTKTKLSASLPSIVRYLNLGLLDQPSFRDALAKEFKLPQIDKATERELFKLAQKAQAQPEGIRRDIVYDQMLKLLNHAKGVSIWDIARDFWYANVLSGIRTHVDIGMGSWITGLTEAVRGAAYRQVVYLGNLAKDPALAKQQHRQGARILTSFFARMGDGWWDAIDLLKTGDTTSLPGAQDRLVEQLSGLHQVNTLETLKRTGTGWRKIAGQFAFVSRLMLAMDYLIAPATRQAMMMYAAASRGDLDTFKLLYESQNKKARAAATAQAEKEMGKDASKAHVRARAREILHAEVPAEIKKEGDMFANLAALNIDPIGWGGWLYRMLSTHNSAGFFFRSALGLNFLRASINMVQQAVDWMPGLGYVNYLRAAPDAKNWFKKLSEKHPLRAFALDEVSQERREMILAAQIGGLFLWSAAAALWLVGRDDDDEHNSEISGTWDALTRQEQNQLRSRGERPLSIRLGSTWVSYKNTPLAAMLAWVGNVRDRQRFKGQKWTAQALGHQLLDGFLMGFTYIKDISPLSQFSQIIGVASYGPQDIDSEKANRWLATTMGGMAGGFVPASSLLKDIDAWTDPSLYRPNTGIEFWLRQLPFARRYASSGPAVNMLGETIEVSRAPLSRWLSPENRTPVWDAVAAKAAQGVFIPIPSRNAPVIDRASGEKRDMNQAEFFAYSKAAGTLWKETITRNLPAFRKMTPQQAEAWIDRLRERIHTRARAALR